VLYISPRGARYRFQEHVNEEFIRNLARKIGLKRRYRYFRI